MNNGTFSHPRDSLLLGEIFFLDLQKMILYAIHTFLTINVSEENYSSSVSTGLISRTYWPTLSWLQIIMWVIMLVFSCHHTAAMRAQMVCMSILDVCPAVISRMSQNIRLHCMLADGLFHYSPSRRDRKLIWKGKKIYIYFFYRKQLLNIVNVPASESTTSTQIKSSKEGTRQCHLWMANHLDSESHIYIFFGNALHTSEEHGKRETLYGLQT